MASESDALDVGDVVVHRRGWREQTVVDGIDNAPEAFISMLRGANTGKMVVRVA